MRNRVRGRRKWHSPVGLLVASMLLVGIVAAGCPQTDLLPYNMAMIAMSVTPMGSSSLKTPWSAPFDQFSRQALRLLRLSMDRAAAANANTLRWTARIDENVSPEYISRVRDRLDMAHNAGFKVSLMTKLRIHWGAILGCCRAMIAMRGENSPVVWTVLPVPLPLDVLWPPRLPACTRLRHQSVCGSKPCCTGLVQLSR